MNYTPVQILLILIGIVVFITLAIGVRLFIKSLFKPSITSISKHLWFDGAMRFLISILLLPAVSFVVSVAIFGIIIIGSTELIQTPTAVLNLSRDRVVEFIEEYKYENILWKWDKRLKNPELLYNYQERKIIRNRNLSFISDSRIYKLSYTFQISVPENIDIHLALIKFEEKQGQSIDSFIDSLVYELERSIKFNEFEFYNPLDKKQQENFNELIKEFLLTHIENLGLEFEGASFNVD